MVEKRIGILALQGGFLEHKKALDKLGIPSFEIRKKSHLHFCSMDGLILPGGESTVMGKLLYEQDMCDYLSKAIKSGLPVFGTCAGLILLAKHIINYDKRYLAVMDIVVERNAYGRQLESFHTMGFFTSIGKIPMTFIRAPRIRNVCEKVQVLAENNGDIVAARQQNMLVTAFHPELTSDLRVHQYFLEHIK